MSLILSFDTSTSACDVALLRNGELIAHEIERMEKGQAERLLMLCTEMLDAAKASVSDLSAIGVGIGPGNFTGIRISVSAARGLALGLDLPAVGVSSFEALHFGFNAPCLCTVDARRDQVYTQEFTATQAAREPTLVPKNSLADCELPVIGAGGREAKYPLAAAIAMIADARRKKPHDRPAPLYLRPADAAPAKDAPPEILR